MTRALPLLTAGAVLLAALIGFEPAGLSSPAWAQGACDPGDRPDNTTATDARRKLEAAGYRQARDLKKGCDNVWHGKAVKDGRPVNVALSPRGEIFIETE
ncbi:MAG: PepSY domain-containing protein [Alphaproteobacteria bacterium]|nr:PepSY domain-containing protein [Alphaproteobacteria bacterium]